MATKDSAEDEAPIASDPNAAQIPPAAMDMDSTMIDDPVPADPEFRQHGWTSLTFPVYIFMGLQLVIWILFFVWMWELGFALVLFYIPQGILIWWWNKNRSYCTINHILTQYAHGFVVVFLAVNIVTYLFLFVVLPVVWLMTRLIDPSGHLLFFVLGFIYVVIEECFKIYFARRSRRMESGDSNDASNVTKKHLMASVATSLGYSTSTSLLWTVILVLIFGHLTVGWFFFVTFFLSVIGLPLHVLCGYLVGLEVMKGSKFVSILKAPVMSRSIYIWLLLAILMAEVTWLAITALVLILVEYVLFFVYIKQVERTLPFDYLRRVGQLNVFGYGVLPDAPDDEMDDGPVVVGVVAAESPASEPQVCVR